MKRNNFLSLVIVLLGLICGSMVFAKGVNTSNPVDMLNGIAQEMIENLKANQATIRTNPSYVYSLARRLVVPHADLSEMSKRVLPPRVWESATQGQRAVFEKEFTTLVIRTYGSALAEYSNQTVRFFPLRGGQSNNTVRVDSQIVRNDGPSISMNYRLILKGGQWKLYDMTVEGVSLIESFRSQFADKLSQGGNINDLIRDLKQHNAANN